MILAGEFAALGTALCWSIGPVLFTLAGKQIGAMNVNRFRLLLAFVFFYLTYLLVFRKPFPTDLPTPGIMFLLASGISGMAIGDSMMYQAFLHFGPRRTMLITAIVPLISTLAAWGFLFEIPSILQVLGILLSISGVAWVVMARSEQASVGKSNLTRGTLLAFGAALGQAGGLILAKHAMVTYDISPLPTNLIRNIGALTVLWGITVFSGKAGATFRTIKNTKVILIMIVASLIGPFAGIGLSMVAINLAPVGVASAIMATNPIIIIPFSHFILGDRAGWRGAGGAVLAVAGVVLLMLVSS